MANIPSIGESWKKTCDETIWNLSCKLSLQNVFTPTPSATSEKTAVKDGPKSHTLSISPNQRGADHVPLPLAPLGKVSGMMSVESHWKWWQSKSQKENWIRCQHKCSMAFHLEYVGTINIVEVKSSNATFYQLLEFCGETNWIEICGWSMFQPQYCHHSVTQSRSIFHVVAVSIQEETATTKKYWNIKYQKWPSKINRTFHSFHPKKKTRICSLLLHPLCFWLGGKLKKSQKIP